MQIASFINQYFAYEHLFDEDGSKRFDGKFHLHDDALEITYIKYGDIQIRTELGIYKIAPYDTFIARPNELHGIAFAGAAPYDRRSFYIPEQFFEHNNCGHFLTDLNENTLKRSSIVNAETSPYDIKGLLNSFEEYVKNGDTDDAFLESMVTQYLYMLIHSSDESDKKRIKNDKINEVIGYINSHIMDELSLDKISSEMFMSKQYMCRMFKSYTGFTVKSFITEKRLQLANELYRQNKNLLEASLRSGFKSYSSFYRAHMEKYGCPPQKRMHTDGEHI